MDLYTDLFSIWRVFNLVLAALGGCLLTFKTGRMWVYLDVQAKFLYVSAISFCIAHLWGTAESLARDLPGGPRVLIATLPLLWAIISGVTPPSPARMRALEQVKR